jgi:hypothetical protein
LIKGYLKEKKTMIIRRNLKNTIRNRHFAQSKMVKPLRLRKKFSDVLDLDSLEHLAKEVEKETVELMDNTKIELFDRPDSGIVTKEESLKDHTGYIPYDDVQVEVEIAAAPVHDELRFKFISGDRKDFQKAVEAYERIAELDLENADGDIMEALDSAEYVWLGIFVCLNKGKPSKVLGYMRYENSNDYEYFYAKEIDLTVNDNRNLSMIMKAVEEALQSMDLI